MQYRKVLRPFDSEQHKVCVLIKRTSWCCEAEGNSAGTIAGKLTADPYLHRVEASVELPATAPVLDSALKCIAADHVESGTPCLVHLQLSTGVLGGGVGRGGS